MTAASRIRWCGTVQSRGDATALIPKTGDVVLVARGGKARWLVFRCPSGCGEELPINLDSRSGPAWRVYEPGPSASLYPSVWRESGCRAHFILSRGRLWVFSGERVPWEDVRPEESFVARVRDRLAARGEHYVDIAESIDGEPWDTLRACRLLVRLGDAIEGIDSARGYFRASRS
jgi:hypothetical protein